MSYSQNQIQKFKSFLFYLPNRKVSPSFYLSFVFLYFVQG